MIENYLTKNDEIVRDNANHNKSFSGLQAYLAGEQIKEYALSLLDPEDRKLFEAGALHIHNLDAWTVPYCHGGSLTKLLALGINSGGMHCSPAKHLDTAVDHIANYLIISQQEFAGAQALSDFNSLLAPFIRKDNLNDTEIKQCLQRLIYNVNFPSRSNFQTPFVNLTFNLNCPRMLENLPAIIGGKPRDDTYADYLEEEHRIAKIFAELLIGGDATGRPFTFPIPTLNLTKRVDQNSEAYTAIIESIVKTGSWYTMNYIGSGIDENNIRALCCRLTLNLKELVQAGGLWNIGDGVGSQGVVSLSLPRLGYLMRKGSSIYDALDGLLASARRILQVKRRLVTKTYNDEYLPFAKYYGLNLDHYFNTIGLIGLNEMWLNIDGYGTFCHIKESADILDYINSRLRKFQEEDGILYNLEMTPGEGACSSLARKNLIEYPDIKTLGGPEEPYYTTLLTNPAENVEWMYRAEEESKLLPKFSGGTVFRTYLAREDNVEHTKWLIKYLAAMTIPYFDFTPTIAYCPTCQIQEISPRPSCPKCGGPRELWSRVVGYIRPVNKWSNAKQAEFRARTYMEYG